MKRTKKRLLLLLVLLFFLGFVYYLPNLKQKLTPKKQKKLFPFKKEEITEIEFYFSKDNKQYLKKRKKTWKVIENNKEYTADKDRVNNLIEFLTTLEKNEIVSKNKKKHKSFGIGEKKIVVKNKNGKVFTLFLGKPAGIQKYYVKIDNENEVFTAQGLELYPQDFKLDKNKKEK